jgi:NAD(P)H-flavin reductase
MVPERHRILKVRRETRDTFTLMTQPVEQKKVFPFAPGQFSMIYAFGVGEVPISISGDPGHPETLVHTIRAVGTVTHQLHTLKTDDMIGIRGPYGSPWPLSQARGNDVVIVAGGLGLAPVRPVIYQLLAERQRFGNIAILYGARSPEDMLYLKELEQWRGRFDLHVDATVDSAQRGWLGHVGVVTQLIGKAPFDPANTVAMICGPEIMMRFTIMELQKQGLDAENIFVSMERNMKCAIGFCGHCQYGPHFICKDGPVFPYDRIQKIFKQREI